MNGQHGATRLAHDLIGHAAPHYSADGWPAPAGQHDHVRPPGRRLARDGRRDLSAWRLHDGGGRLCAALPGKQQCLVKDSRGLGRRCGFLRMIILDTNVVAELMRARARTSGRELGP
jgi:hypothetical protein